MYAGLVCNSSTILTISFLVFKNSDTKYLNRNAKVIKEAKTTMDKIPDKITNLY